MKKFTAILIVFSIIVLSINLYAKERRGAELVVTKKDGQQIQGELITVKETLKEVSLLLLDTEGKDVSVDIADIEVITIVKKSKAGLGALIGLGIGSGIGIGYAVLYQLSEGESGVGIGILLAAAATGLGAFMGASAGTDETIKGAVRTDDPSERIELVRELRKKARIRNYK